MPFGAKSTTSRRAARMHYCIHAHCLKLRNLLVAQLYIAGPDVCFEAAPDAVYGHAGAGAHGVVAPPQQFGCGGAQRL
jgi:hypothetical protein